LQKAVEKIRVTNKEFSKEFQRALKKA
jgi:hypothetical protein